VTPDRWLETAGRAWTNKEVLGHLAAWSDLLLDQAEALESGRPGSVAAVDVDSWNAAEVARRRAWTVEQMIACWRESVRRALRLAARLSPESLAARWPVAWTTERVSIDQVLRLWVVHVGQHTTGSTVRRL
jgi:hypothetical protein